MTTERALEIYNRVMNEDRPKVGITLAEYNRRWDLIMAAFLDRRLSLFDASAAIADLTSLPVWR